RFDRRHVHRHARGRALEGGPRGSHHRSRARPGGRPVSDATTEVDPNEPVEGANDSEQPVEGASDSEQPVEMMDYFMHLEYHELVCPIVLRYAASLMEGKILGQISPNAGLVFVPPRSYDPVACEWLGDDHLVELEDRGVITNFTIVTPVQYYGQEKTEPFAKASILLDGPGGMLSLQDILEIPPEAVRVGMRVEAVWLPEHERS